MARYWPLTVSVNNDLEFLISYDDLELDGTEVIVMKKGERGFASMNPEKQREIARKGGRAAHEKGTAHEFTSAEAKIAGRKGGKMSHSGGRKSENLMDETEEM